MLRSLTTVVLSVLLSTALIVGLAHYTPTANYSQVREATVLVTSEDGSCSGVVIAVNKVLTAAHCDAPDMKVEGKAALKIKKSEEADLMLLVTDTGNLKPLAIAKVRPMLDEKVIQAGFPLGAGEVVTEGRLQALIADKMPHHMLVSSLAVFGNSGGPVVVRRGMNYEVVGICSTMAGIGGMFMVVPITHLQFVVNTETINEFLK